MIPMKKTRIDSDYEEEHEEEFFEEEEMEIPDEYDFCILDYKIMPKHWTGDKRYNQEMMKQWYDEEEDQEEYIDFVWWPVAATGDRWRTRRRMKKNDDYFRYAVEESIFYQLERTVLQKKGIIVNLNRWRKSRDECRDISVQLATKYLVNIKMIGIIPQYQEFLKL
jgi:hypothetical protein